MILETIKKFLELLDARERRNVMLLFCMMIGTGVMEVVGVVSVVPFIAVVAKPELIETNEYLSAIYAFLGFSDFDSFLIFLGLCVFTLLIVRLAFTALTQWAIIRFSNMRSYTLSSRLLRSYMNRPYSFFLDRHSSDLGKNLLSEVSLVIGKGLMPALNLTSYALVALLLIGLVVAVNPMVAFTGIVVLGGAYGLIYLSLRRYTAQLGIERVQCNSARFRVAQEALNGIKEVKVLGLEDGYIRGFSQPAKRLARVQARSKIIGDMPQYFMRAVVFGSMLILVIIMIGAYDGDLGSALPIIAVYAYAGNRLIPALQNIYKGVLSLRFGKYALDNLHNELVKSACAEGLSNTITGINRPPIPLTRELELECVRFVYPGAEKPALYDLSLSIPACTTVGLVGETGAGKTTVVDLILGLLEPQTGKLLVDGQHITGKDLRAWQRNIGYVPQSIFLSDDSLAANVAFGVPENKIDWQAVEHASRIAELHEFVVNEMPQGYATLVGERGVRLSGGQRQRIGIARALYQDPGVLVFDEATSALDNVTEKAVMDAVHNLAHRKTIIIIAHRLSTVRECDKIFMLDHGRLLDKGTYNELAARNPRFRAMAGLSN